MTRLRIGLDPGVTTGFATWDRVDGRLLAVTSMSILGAMKEVKALAEAGQVFDVTFEDARQRKFFGSEVDARFARSGAGVREGAGSVKRDCSIWQEFLTDLGVTFHMCAPQPGGTKWTADYFRRVTGWPLRTNEHGRDAALLILGSR
jgi:hypothetical protein